MNNDYISTKRDSSGQIVEHHAMTTTNAGGLTFTDEIHYWRDLPDLPVRNGHTLTIEGSKD